jgi:hypothetical protein
LHASLRQDDRRRRRQWFAAAALTTSRHTAVGQGSIDGHGVRIAMSEFVPNKSAAGLVAIASGVYRRIISRRRGIHRLLRASASKYEGFR